jgi:pimeloyl-ACP methyl ester carboxylesterase
MSVIETSAGRIGLSVMGNGSATPILFLHGVGSDKSAWRPQLDHLGIIRRAVAIDYPGYGEASSIPRPPATTLRVQLSRRLMRLRSSALMCVACRLGEWLQLQCTPFPRAAAHR